MMSATRISRCFITVLAGLLISQASAADLAELGSTGFSDDGAYFAFEQYGIQDGSGFPYSSITIVDVKSDSWVAGTRLMSSWTRSLHRPIKHVPGPSNRRRPCCRNMG